MSPIHQDLSVEYDDDQPAPQSRTPSRGGPHKMTGPAPAAATAPKRRPRGPGVATYTRQDIAREANVSITSVYDAERSGRLVFGDLGSVSRYIARPSAAAKRQRRRL